MSHALPDSTGTFPIEPKVWSSTAAASATTLLLTILAAVLGDGDGALILGFLPAWAEPIALSAVTAGFTLLAGWQAAHQHRRPVPAPTRKSGVAE